VTRRRQLALALILLVLVAATTLAIASRQPALPARQSGERPVLLLLTSLPLMFGEEFSLEQSGSRALSALEDRYRVVPISTTDPAELGKGALLLMAHPPAQTAENLVALDAWVRRGGHVLLLADPMLEWPSERPLGDPLRAPPMFADTGLLGHWGLRLDAPDERGPKQRRLGGRDVITASPGALSGNCPVSADRLVARCDIGKGQAIIVADADWLDAEHLDGPAGANLNSLLAELAGLERR
jgi:hypothetical protein